MKKNVNCILNTAGIISSTFLLQACNNSDSADELNRMIQSHQDNDNNFSIGKPIGLDMDENDKEYISFLENLSNDIRKNPEIANDFINNPNKYCKKFGYNYNVNISKSMIGLISALGDKQLNESVGNGDIKEFIKICKEKGVISFNSISEDKYLKKIANQLSDNTNINKSLYKTNLTRASEKIYTENDNEKILSSFVYGAVAIVIAAVAVEAFVVIGTTTWVTHVHGKDAKVDENSNDAIKLWELKKGEENTYIPAGKINDEIVNEGMKIIQENFPEVYNNVDKVALRNLILINVQNNCNYD